MITTVKICTKVKIIILRINLFILWLMLVKVLSSLRLVLVKALSLPPPPSQSRRILDAKTGLKIQK
jgi:hypothetical protein